MTKISIDEKEIKWHFIRARGPGGQKVNKTATAVQLRFNIKRSLLPEEIKQRLFKIAGNRVNSEGELVITARQFRTQPQNRQDALNRLMHFIELASHAPKLRKKTKIPRSAKEKRLKDKRKRAEIKRTRHSPME